MPMLKTILRRLSSKHQEVAASEPDPEPTSVGHVVVDRLIADMEEAALEVYQTFGLPTEVGHYARSPDAQGWQFLGKVIDVPARWALISQHPGWRFGTLETLGAAETSNLQLVRAARLLSVCSNLRRSPANSSDISEAIFAGSAWQSMKQAREYQDVGRLKLAPAEKPSRRRGKL